MTINPKDKQFEDGSRPEEEQDRPQFLEEVMPERFEGTLISSTSTGFPGTKGSPGNAVPDDEAEEEDDTGDEDEWEDEDEESQDEDDGEEGDWEDYEPEREPDERNPRGLWRGIDDEAVSAIVRWAGAERAWEALSMDHEFFHDVLEHCTSCMVEQETWDYGMPGMSGIEYTSPRMTAPRFASSSANAFSR
jgi:hypothetical protein